jgi:sec-independent protein translocase protein TatC
MDQEGNILKERLGGQMSFLSHLDEFRKRLVNSLIAVALAFIFCWFVADKIFNFLAVPVQRALTEAQRNIVPLQGQTGNEQVLAINQLKEGQTGRYVFDRATNLGVNVIAPGTAVSSIVAKDSNGNLGLFTNETLITRNSVIPKGIRLPADLTVTDPRPENINEQMIVTTAIESFTLYVTVSLYSAIALAIPFLLLQIWGFISPALYSHERKYVTPFVFLSSISFVLGAAFAYYILLPPALGYLLGLGEDFRLLLRVTDYFDFVTLIMLAMGIIFQMPAIAYVLSRIGVITAGFMVRSWKVALIVMLIVAAFVSPTGDVPNMMLFATPMMVLYLVSILVAWFFGKKRESDPDDI